MAKRIDIDIDMNVDDSELDKIQSRLDDLKKQKLEAKLEADTSALDDVNTKISNLKKLLFMMEMNMDVDDSEIKKVQAELKELEAQKLDLEIKVADSEVKIAKKEIDDLKGEKVSVDVDVDTSQIKNARSEIDSLASSVQNQMSGVGSAVTGIVAGMAGKSIWDTIYGTSKKAETNKILLKNMADVKTSAETLYNTIDKTTDNSLVSMQELIPALNGIKAATGSTAGEINSITPGVAAFGQYVYALTGSSAKAETAMFDLSKGIKGMYASLDQYGITEQALMDTGLWSGKEDDVQGYIAAVNQVTGNTDELMNSTQGLEALMGKAFSRAGKVIGGTVLPVVKNLLQGFLDIDEQLGGLGSTAVLGLGGLVTVAGMGFSAIGQMAGGFRAVRDAVKVLRAEETIWAGIKTLLVGAETAETVATEASTMAWLGLGAAEDFALWPILLIIGAIVALGAAFYKIGEWLGWWSDFGGMIEAVKAGVMRLWNAFINSRAVQAAISAVQWFIEQVKHGLELLWSFIQPVLSAIWEAFAGLFGDEGSSPDAIQAVIDAFTFLEDVVIGVFDAIQFVIGQVINLFLPVISGVQVIAQVLQGMFTGQIGILDGLMIIGQTVANMFVGFWSNLGNLFMQGFMTLMNIAFNGLLSIWNSFLSFLAHLATVPASVGAYLLSVVQKVISWASNMVSKAQTAATNFVNNVVNGIASLPGKFKEKLDGVFQALVDWGKRMVEKAQNIASDVLNALADAVNPLSSGFDGGFDAGFTSYGFDSGNTLNSSLSSSSTTNRSHVTNNFSINGIIEEEASEYIVNAVNENIRRQNLIRGV